MVELLLVLQLASTLALFGLIWFVQVVHYPLFDKVGFQAFQQYEESHQRRTTWVVAPLMLTEAGTAVASLWIRPPNVSLPFAICGLVLVAVIWASTFFWQVPVHQLLVGAFDASAHRELVHGNWVRTAAWTARAALLCWMCLRCMTEGAF